MAKSKKNYNVNIVKDVEQMEFSNIVFKNIKR